MAADRVARGRKRTDQILAFDPTRRHKLPPPGRFRRNCAGGAHRARLPGAQAGGRARPFQRVRMARLPPPRHSLTSGRRFPPQDLVAPGRSRHLRYPTVTDSEVPPLRPKRHIPNSIATVLRRLIAALVSRLPRCPCCAAPIARRMRRQTL